MNLSDKTYVFWRSHARIGAGKVASLRKVGCRGVAAIEFALTLSLWSILLLGIIDGSYYMLINERIDRIAYSITDIVTQYQTKTSGQLDSLTNSKLNDIMLAAGQLMQPLAFNPATLGTQNHDGSYPTATGYIIVTSIYQDPVRGAIICWQHTYPPAGHGVEMPRSTVVSLTDPTKAVLPSGFTLNNQENVIITEVSFTFEPFFLDKFIPKVVFRLSVYKPRLSPLTNSPST